MDTPFFLSRSEVRELDRRAISEYGVPGIVLMENAGRGAAEILLRYNHQRAETLVICGKGNNGGDGFVIARHLEYNDCPVRIILLADPAHLKGDAAINFGIVSRSKIPIEIYTEYPLAKWVQQLQPGQWKGKWVVDALFGTGLEGKPLPPFDSVLSKINQAAAQVLAIDLPSGIDADTGVPYCPPIRAHHTVTFVAAKKGFHQPHAWPWLGEVHVVDIGAPKILVDEYRQLARSN